MQDTNLKISPYFDDFDRSKNYQKILFKPGYSVQTRELNALQSTLQNQVERFGQHVFKEGSVVIPGNVSYNLNFKAVLVQGLINGISVEGYRTNLKGKILTGASSGVQAEVLDTISATTSEKETITLYVKYISAGNTENNTQLNTFKNNEVLSDETGTPVAVTSVQNATAYTGSSATISAGVYFIRGFFVEVATQKIILDQYSNRPSYKLGLQINESLITSDDDSSLFDNALGSSNFASPGADRLQIVPKLVKQNLTFSNSADFIELLRLEEGKATLTALSEDSVYNELEKNLARRTYDESGDYTVRPYSFKVREALDTGNNNGVYKAGERIFDGRTIVRTVSPSDPADAILGDDYYAIELSQGKAYVKGFEVTNDRKQIAVVAKPRTTTTFNNSGSPLNIGSYLKIQDSTVKGLISFPNFVYLKDVDGTEIGRAIAVGLTKGKLYLTEISTYQTITITTGQSHNFASGDFMTGAVSGATGVVKSISGQSVVLQQVNGTFVTGEVVNNSRYTTSQPTISAIAKEKLEDVREVDNAQFEVLTDLEGVKLTGSSFVVASGTSLTGISTNFGEEVSAKSKLRVGTVETEVTSATGTTVTTTTTLSNGTYYDVKKLITKLYASSNGLVSRLSNRPLKSTSDYSANRLVYTGEYTTSTNGDFIIQSSPSETIDKDSVIITTSGALVAANLTQPAGSGNVINVDTALSAGTPVSVYYNSRVSNPKSRTKEIKKYTFLVVDKLKDGSANDGNIYGTRVQDKDISLKFPDVSKIHSIHQAVRDSDPYTSLFDSLILNTVGNLKVGDIIETNTIKATIVSIDTGSSKVYVKYEGSKFTIGDNLSIAVTVPTNADVDNIFVRQSIHGRYIDVTDDFMLSRNDTNDFYRPSKLVRKFNSATPSTKLVVIFDYFEHTNLQNDFYSAESFGELTYKDIPKTQLSVSMADVIDYRFYTPVSTITSASQNGTLTKPHREVSNVFDVYSHSYTSQPVPYPGTIFSSDIEAYLGRNDSIYLTKDGELKVVTGADSLDPKPTLDPSTGILLGSVQLPPYLKSVYDANVIVEDTRQYTMRDIGKLEKRLSNVEQYTTLTLLETSTNNLNVLDEDGKNRFKNGFVVDNFRSTNVADLQNYDYTASIDVNDGCVRPYPYVNSVGFTFNNTSSSSQQTGQYATIPYTEVSYASQPYASRVENVTPFEAFSFIGEMTLEPKKDIWYDTQREILEGQNIDLTQSISTLFDLVVPGGTVWNEWELGAGGADRRRPGGTTITDIRSGTNYEVGNLDVEIESGDTIQSIADIRYARSRIVNLTTKGLKPKTEHGLYVGDKDAEGFTYPKVLRGLKKDNSNRFAVGERVRIFPSRVYTQAGVNRCIQLPPNFEDRYLEATVQDPRTFLSSSEISTSDFVSGDSNPNNNGYTSNTTMLVIDNITNWDADSQVENIGRDFIIVGQTSLARTRYDGETGQKLISNALGTLEAFVVLPETTFESGDLEFKLSDDPTNIQVKNLTSSYSLGTYYSQGTQLDVTSTITTLETPQVSITSVEGSRTRFIPDPPPPPPPAPRGGGGGDPLAQSFVIEEPGGIFVTSIDLYFLTKDDLEPVTLELRTVTSGTPNPNIVPGSVVTLDASAVNISNDASVATKFTFKNPIYLSDVNEYAFVTKSSSQKYNLWVSRVGEVDISSGSTIDRQPHIGVVFKSANQTTWISDQYEDIKFNLNRAKFTTGQTYSVVLNNTKVPAQKLQTNALSMIDGSSVITVTQPNHGMHQNQNKVTITGVESDTQPALLSTDLTTTGNTITINDITNSSFTPSTVEGWSTIDNAPVSSSNAGFVKIEEEVISYTGISGNTLTGCVRGALGTTAVVHVSETPVHCFQCNGIALNQLNTTVTISKVISLDEYEITVSNSANASKKCGGTNIRASRNISYESITPNISSLVPQDTVARVKLDSVSGTSIGNTSQTSFVTKAFETIENGVENTLSDPRLVLSSINNTTYGSGGPGTLNAVIDISTDNDFLSPIIDVQGSSIITVSNRLNKEVDSNGVLDLSSELAPRGGKHSAYITKKVVLDNDSTSVKVLFDAVRNNTNEIKVFVKVKGDSQPGSFDNMNYIEVPAVSYPSSDTSTQYRAFDFELKNMVEFQEFSIKVVMIGNDQSNVPKIKNFRAMALAI